MGHARHGRRRRRHWHEVVIIMDEQRKRAIMAEARKNVAELHAARGQRPVTIEPFEGIPVATWRREVDARAAEVEQADRARRAEERRDRRDRQQQDWAAWCDARIAAAIEQEREHIFRVVGEVLRETFEAEMSPIERKVVEMTKTIERQAELIDKLSTLVNRASTFELPSLHEARNVN
jgi:hypothetical protein